MSQLLFSQDSNPKGVIRLLPTGWSKTITQGTPRMPDAVVSSSDKGPGIMSVVSYCENSYLKQYFPRH